MARVTQTQVEGIIDVESGFDLTPFITMANELVTECCGSSTTYTASRLLEIERLLAAHFYTIYEARPTREGVEGVSVQYESKVDLGFNVSKYGQMALRLDTEGGLARLEAQAKKGTIRTASVTWLGKEDDTVETEE